jgi:integrase
MRRLFQGKERPMRQFYLHPRNGIIYVQFVDQKAKKCLPALSTKKTNRDEALIVVYDWLKNGVPKRESKTARQVDEEMTVAQILRGLKNSELTNGDVSKIEKILQDQGLITLIVQKNSLGSQLFTDFLEKFWDYDRSPYVEERKSHKINITRAYLAIFHGLVKNYWLDYFKGYAIEEITRKKLTDFSNHISASHSHLSSQTLRQILKAGKIALRWAYANEYISIDPTKYMVPYSSQQKNRGVLSPNEAAELFSLKWESEMGFLINIVAMSTGLRVGEILALRLEDIGGKYLSVTRSYSNTDGFKSTKTEEPRVVPIIPSIRDALRKMGEGNPYGDGLVFYGNKPNTPMSRFAAHKFLNSMLIKLRLGNKMAEFAPSPGDSRDVKKAKREGKEKAVEEAKKYWKERNVVFHSWRHFYAARMVDRIAPRKVMLATGHKTEAVFKGYADHGLEDDLAEVATTTAEVFGGLLPRAIASGEEGEK